MSVQRGAVSDAARIAWLASAGTLALGLAAAVAADPAEALKGSGQVIVSTWGGGYTDAQVEALFDPFQAASGVSVVTTGSPDVAKMKLMEDSGSVEWDIVDAEAQMMYKAIEEGLLQPIDYDLIYSVVPKADLIPDNLKEYGFPSISFGWVLSWNPKAFPNGAPHSWADFWDTEKFPGRRALYAQPKPLLEFALLADGVPMDQLYPLDVDRAFKKLDEIRPHIDVWYEDLGQADTLLQNGEVDMILTSNGRAYSAKQSGASVDFTFNEGAWEQGYWVVMKNAPNPENAMKLIAWTALPQGEADFAAKYAYGGPNLQSYAMMPPEVAAGLPTTPENLTNQVTVDGKWWADNLDAVNRRWLEWYTGG
jgi:putative spermidine/putrescine transport system substrate-binding protein